MDVISQWDKKTREKLKDASVKIVHFAQNLIQTVADGLLGWVAMAPTPPGLLHTMGFLGCLHIAGTPPHSQRSDLEHSCGQCITHPKLDPPPPGSLKICYPPTLGCDVPW